MKEGKRLYELKRMHLLYKLEDMIPSGLQHRLLVILVNYELLMSHENHLILIYAYQTVPKAHISVELFPRLFLYPGLS